MKSKFFFVMSVASAMLLASCNQPAPATTSQESSPAATSSTVAPEVVSVACTPSSNEVQVGKTITLVPVVTVKGDANKRCTFKSSNEKIATVNSTGVVEGVSAGEVTITITSVADTTKKCEVKLTVVGVVITQLGSITELPAADVTVKGAVVAVTKQGILLNDGTGVVHVFFAKTPDYSVGQVLQVSGKLVDYHGYLQFSCKDSDAVKPTIDVVDEVAPTFPAAVELTKEVADKWGADKKIPFSAGKLYKWTTRATKEGTYDALNFPGSSTIIEPSYSPKAIVENKQYEVEGYVGAYDSKYNYAVLFITSLTEKQAEAGTVTISADKKTIGVGESAKLTAAIEQGAEGDHVDWAFKEAGMSEFAELVPANNPNEIAVKGLKAGEVTVVASRGNFSDEVKITIVEAQEVAISNITEEGKVYSATGVVAALTLKGFILSDGAASIYVFTNDAPTVVVGDMVNVEGGVALYNKVFQFSVWDKVKPVTVTKVEGNIPNLPVALDLTKEIVQGWKDGTAFPTTDVKLYKWTAKATKPDRFVMTNLEGCEIDIEPSYVPSGITLKVGKTYDLEAYFGGYNNTNAYAAMYITKAEEVGGGEQTSEQGSQPAESTEQGQSTEQGSVEVKNHGTVSEPISVAEAKSIIADLADPTSKGNVYDDEMLYVTGVVVEVTYAWKTGKSMSFTLKDANAIDGDALAAQFIYLAADLTEAPAAGDTVLLRGYAAKYNNGSVVTPQISAPKDAGEDTRATVLSFQKAGGQQTSEQGSQPVDSSEVAPVESSEIIPLESSSEQGNAGVAATMTAGTNGARAKVNGQDAIKVGNKSNGGDLTITVGAGATKVAFYAGAWKGENSTSITLSGATADPAEFTLTACAAFTGSTTNYTVESEATYYIEADLAGIAEETVITLTSASKRFVVWNAVYFTA